MGQILTSRERGTFNDACERAAIYANQQGGGLGAAERFLDRSGWSHATFGIVSGSCCGRTLEHLNRGDTYDLTLGQETGDVFTTTWDDWVEQVEREYCEAEDMIRCSYCGEFTSVAEPRDNTTCGACGHNVFDR